MKDQKIFIDQFEKLFLLKEEKLKNTIWFGPISSITGLRKQFDPRTVGLIKSLRVKNGKKLQVKSNSRNSYLFVEFENEADSNKVAALMRKRKNTVSAKSYVAGSNTFVVIRRSKRK